jgi:tRNA 2-thiouridine synthesizing protein A
MVSGQILKVLATDPGSLKDFEAFSRQTGNALIRHAEQDQVFEYLIRRK